MDNNLKAKTSPPPLPAVPPPPLTPRRSISTNNESITTASLLPSQIPLEILIDNNNNKSKTNVFSSILITQLNEKIQSTNDIDVKVLKPHELNIFNKLNEPINSNLLTTVNNASNANWANNDETIKKRRIDIDQNSSYNTTQISKSKVVCESIECQTDFKLEPILSSIQPTFSDIESIGIYYFDPATNNLTNTDNIIISDDEYIETEGMNTAVEDINENDPCTAYEVYKRECKKKGLMPPKRDLKYKTQTTQTVLSIIPERDRSTQTSPSLLREFVMSDLTNLLAYANNNQPFKAPTNENLINEKFNLTPKNYEKQQQKEKDQENEQHLSEASSIASDTTSFEQPLCENLDIKYAEIFQEGNETDNSLSQKSNKNLTEPQQQQQQQNPNNSARVGSAHTVSERSTSFYTVATHITTTTTISDQISNTPHLEYVSSQSQYETAKSKKSDEVNFNRIVVNSFENNGQLVKLNETISGSHSPIANDMNVNKSEQEVRRAQDNIEGQSDRTSVISDNENNDIDYIDSENITDNVNANERVGDDLVIVGKILYELKRDEANKENKNDSIKFAESKLIKDKYEIFYPEEDRINVAIVPDTQQQQTNETTPTVVSPRTPASINELDSETTYDLNKLISRKPQTIECSLDMNRKTIKFNEDVDVIEPSDYSTATNSTSNIATKFENGGLIDNVKVDSSSDELEATKKNNYKHSAEDNKNKASSADELNTIESEKMIPKFDQFTTFKWQAPKILNSETLQLPVEKANKLTPKQSSSSSTGSVENVLSSSSPQSSSSFLNKEGVTWDNTPVKSYNSLISTKPFIKQYSLDANLQKTLNTFDLKESKAKKGIKYVEKSPTQPIQANVYSSDSFERRLKASGFDNYIVSSSSSSKDQKETQENEAKEQKPIEPNSPSFEVPPPPLPATSPPRSRSSPAPFEPRTQQSSSTPPPPERPPLPTLPLSKPKLPPRISQNTKFNFNEFSDNFDTDLKFNDENDNNKSSENSPNLINESFQSQKSSTNHSILSNQENEQNVKTRTSSSSNSTSYSEEFQRSAIIVDTVEETTNIINTSIITHKTVIQTVELSETSSSSSVLHSGRVQLPIASRPDDSTNLTAPTADTSKSLSKESKFILDDKKIPDIRVDFDSYEAKESIKPNQDAKKEPVIKLPIIDSSDPIRAPPLSNESKLVLERKPILPQIDIDFSIYDEIETNEEPQRPTKSVSPVIIEPPVVSNKTLETLVDKLVDNPALKERHPSLSHESKIILEVNPNIPTIDVDFSIYDEEPKAPSRPTATEVKPVVEMRPQTSEPPSRTDRGSLSKQSKLSLGDATKVPSIDVDFSMYDEQPQIAKPSSIIANENDRKEPERVPLPRLPKLADRILPSTVNQTERPPVKRLFPREPFDDNVFLDNKNDNTIAKKPNTFDLTKPQSPKTPKTPDDDKKKDKKKFDDEDNKIRFGDESSKARSRSLSQEAKLILPETRKIQPIDVDFSIYDEKPNTSPRKLNTSVDESTKLSESKSLAKKSVLNLDKENNFKQMKFDVDFNAYDEQYPDSPIVRRQLDNVKFPQNEIDSLKRDKFKQIDNNIGHQSPVHRSPRQQPPVNYQKQSLKFDFQDWENMLHMVDANAENSQDTNQKFKQSDKNSASYNADDTDDDAAGTEADIDDNDDQDNNGVNLHAKRPNQNTNGIVNMVFDTIPNSGAIKFDDNSFIKHKHQMYEDILNAEKHIIPQIKRLRNPDILSSQSVPLNKPIFIMQEKENKISVTSVEPAPNGKFNEPIFTTHLEKAEIKPESKYNLKNVDATGNVEVTGYNPPGAPTRNNANQISVSGLHKNQNNLENRTPRKPPIPTDVKNYSRNSNEDVDADLKLNEFLTTKRVRRGSGASFAETSSVVTEGSLELDSTSNGKMTRIQKLMLSLADREKIKLLKRIERRKIRIPEILELLKTAKNKEKKKLEDELRILLRKAERDEQLLKKFQINFENESKKSNEKNKVPSETFIETIRKTQSEEVLDNEIDIEVREINNRKSPLSTSAASLTQFPGSGSASGFSNANFGYNDGYSSAGGNSTSSKPPRLTSIRGSATARESGYSSCDESGAELRNYRKRFNSCGSDSRLERVEDDYTTPASGETATEQMPQYNQSSLHSAIKSAVNKLPIDSSTFVLPSSQRILTKSPTLQIGYSHQNVSPAHNRVVFPPNPRNNISPRPTERYLYERPTQQDSYRHDNYDRLTDYNSNQHLDMPDYSRTIIRRQGPFVEDPRPIIGDNVEVRTTSIRPPIDNYVISATNNPQSASAASKDTKHESTNQNSSSAGAASSQRKASTQDNYRRNEGDDDDDQRQNRRNDKFESNQQEQNLRIQYVEEAELGPNYEQRYEIEYDKQTGESFILDYFNNVKYIIVKPKNVAASNQQSRIDSMDEDEPHGLIVEYIPRSAIRNLQGVQIYQDDRTGEEYVEDPNNQYRLWIILPDDWAEVDNNPYVDEDSVNYMQWNVFIEQDTNRKYVVDERDGKQYYVIPEITDKDLVNFKKAFGLTTRESSLDDRKSLNQNKQKSANFQIKWPEKQADNVQESQLNDSESEKGRKSYQDKMEAMKTFVRSGISQTTNVDSLRVKDEETIAIAPQRKETKDAKPDTDQTAKDESKNLPGEASRHDTGLNVGYVEDEELSEIDMHGVPIFQDPTTEESYIRDPQTNRIWIILPPYWRQSNMYVAEEDIDFSQTDVFEDETKRKYVIDDRTGYRYYIVPKVNDVKQTFKYQWSALSGLVPQFDKVVWRKQLDDNKKRDENRDSGDKKRDSRFKMPPFESSLRFGRDDKDNIEVIRNFDSEPGKLSPIKDNGANRIIIKQPGKMGHLIRTDTRGQLRPEQLRYMRGSLTRFELNREVLPMTSPRPLHHLLLGENEKNKLLNELSGELDRFEEADSYLKSSSSGSMGRNWRSTSILDDPTASKTHSLERGSPSLDRNKLLDVQINGYGKELKTRRGHSLNSSYSRSNPYLNQSGYTDGTASTHIHSPYAPLRGVLTEHFKKEKVWQRNHRGIVPRTRLHLKEQVLATPRSQLKIWHDTLGSSHLLKPRIILINDDEHIMQADRRCKVYVQYYYDHDSVLGADPAYLLMLPDRGPVKPTRPLMVTPKELEASGAQMALREAPVFVYHPNGHAYFENIAQYLAGKHPKLSPKTVRKMLQFSDMQDFESYLESKITREEAKRISELSGANLIDVDSIKRDLVNTLIPGSPALSVRTDHSQFYHQHCEYDPLRSENTFPSKATSSADEIYNTKEIEIDGVPIKSTFVSFSPTGHVERVEVEDLPPSVLEAMKEADAYEQGNVGPKQLKPGRNTNQNQYISNPIIQNRNSQNQQPPLQPPFLLDRQKSIDKQASPVVKPLMPFDERTNTLRARYERYNSNVSIK